MGIRTRNQRPQRYELSDFSRGMIRDIDQGDFPRNSLKTIQNMRLTQTGGLKMRNGHVPYAASMGASPVEALQNVRLSAADTLFAVSGNLKKLSAGAFVDTDLTGLDSGKYYCLKGMETKQTGTPLKTGACTEGSTERVLYDLSDHLEVTADTASIASVYASYYGAIADNLGNLYVAYKVSGTTYLRKYTSDFTVEWTSTVTTDSAEFVTVTLDGSDRPVVAWRFSGGADGGRFARFTTVTGTKGTETEFVATGGCDYIRVACDPANDAIWVTWTDNAGALKIRHYNSSFAASFSAVQIIGSGASHHAIGVGSDGHLWIAYKNSTSSLILSKRLSTTGAASGSDATVITANTAIIGLLADTLGNIWVTWRDTTNGSVGKAKCYLATDRSVIVSDKIYTETLETVGTSDYHQHTPVSDGDGGFYLGYENGTNAGRIVHLDSTGTVKKRNTFDSGTVDSARLLLGDGTNFYVSWVEGGNLELRRWIASTEADDAYLGKVLEMTSGKANGQKRIITASEPGAIYLTGLLDEAPEAGDTYSIYDASPHLFICGGATAPGNGIYLHKHDGTTKTAFTDYHPDDMEVHAGRLFAAFGNLLKFSERGLGEEFSRNNWIKVSTAGDNIQRIVAASENQLVIYLADSVSILSGTSPTDFSLAPFTGAPGLRAKKSVAIGGKLQFYLSRRGVELLNTLATNSLAQQLPLSEPIKSLLSAENSSDLDNAVGWVFDNKYFLQVGKRRYIYDIYQSARTGKPVWLTDLLADAAAECQARCALDWNGQLIVGSNTTGLAFTAETEPAVKTQTNYADNAKPYEMLLQSHTLDFGTPQRKLIDRINLNWVWTGSDKGVSLSAALDRSAIMETVGTYGPSPIGGVSQFYRRFAHQIAWKVSGTFPFSSGILPQPTEYVRATLTQAFISFDFYEA